jgi:adenosine deaminase
MEKATDLEKVCYEIPKAELHIHIEGSFEPELMFEIIQRNKLSSPFKSVEEVREKYNFNNLQEFLDMYYAACSCLIVEQDFEDLIYAYLKKASSQGLKYAEIFFDPQTHTFRGIDFDVIINGFKKGIQRASEDFQVEAQLIMCFLRHLSEEEAFKTLEQSAPHRDSILAIGLDSSEQGHPPEKFQKVYQKCKDLGFRLCAHAGEEGPADNIANSIDLLNAERIDHGIAICKDEALLKRCIDLQIPFTNCPLSNVKLQVTPDLSKSKIKDQLDQGLLVMINSDDPAYFGGYVGDNFKALLLALKLSLEDIRKLAENSFKATFLSDEKKQKYIDEVKKYIESLNS